MVMCADMSREGGVEHGGVPNAQHTPEKRKQATGWGKKRGRRGSGTTGDRGQGRKEKSTEKGGGFAQKKNKGRGTSNPNPNPNLNPNPSPNPNLLSRKG